MNQPFASLGCLAMALALVAPDVFGGDTHWVIEGLIGDAYNADSRTRISGQELAAITLDGEYETRGIEGPLHYTLRLARWEDDRAWELQVLHHKLYLKDPPSPVEALSVSHGFNIVTVNRAFAFGAWRIRAGVGPVVTHVEARIAGASYDGPYEIAGAAALVGGGLTHPLTAHLYVIGEISASYAYIEAEPDGMPSVEVSIRNPALHAHVGVGYAF